MKIVVKKTLIALVLSCSMTNFGHAFDIDETVDDEIRKNYNSTQLIDDVGLQDNALEKKIESTVTNINVDPNLPSLPTITQDPGHKHPAYRSAVRSNRTFPVRCSCCGIFPAEKHTSVTEGL